MKLARKKFVPSEHKIQSAVCGYLDVCKRRVPLEYFAIPMGGLRNIRVATQLKAEGARAGSPDLAILRPGGVVIWLEMKREKGRLSEAQKAFQRAAKTLDHFYEVAYSFEEAVSILVRYGIVATKREAAE